MPTDPDLPSRHLTLLREAQSVLVLCAAGLAGLFIATTGAPVDGKAKLATAVAAPWVPRASVDVVAQSISARREVLASGSTDPTRPQCGARCPAIVLARD